MNDLLNDPRTFGVSPLAEYKEFLRGRMPFVRSPSPIRSSNRFSKARISRRDFSAREKCAIRTAPTVAPMLDPAKNRSAALHYWKRIGDPTRRERWKFHWRGSRTFGLYGATRCRMAFPHLLYIRLSRRHRLGYSSRVATPSTWRWLPPVTKATDVAGIRATVEKRRRKSRTGTVGGATR